MLDLETCRSRQRRLLAHLRERNLNAILTTQIEHVQWLSGYRSPITMQPALWLTADGKATLVAPQKAPEKAAVDDILVYEAKHLSTMRNDQRHASAQVLVEHLGGKAQRWRVGAEFSTVSRHYDPLGVTWHDVEPDIYQLRRRKDADELALLRRAINATGKMYEAARAMMRPGVNELDMFNELQGVAVRDLGEMLTGTGNDYQVCSRGGAPRNNVARAGDLYILDLGPAYQGYFADTCRTISVDGKPTDLQLSAWAAIQPVFKLIETKVRPGVRCKAIFEEVQAMLAQSPVGVFNHHLGHGIGLFPHEAPHLNPNWDDTFELGDVFTAEPGLYAPELKAGMRLENNYLVTEAGVELLSPFDLQL